MRALLTGGAGFIGLHLARALEADMGPDDELVLVDHLERHGADAALDDLIARPGVRLHRVDLTLPGAVHRLGEGFDRVYHLAAIVGVGDVCARPAEVVRCNVTSTLGVLDWAASGGLADGGRLFFASTSEVYAGALDAPGLLEMPTGETAPALFRDPGDPRASYAISKLVGESYLIHLARREGFHAVIGRYHNVYGPRMGRSHVIPQVIERLMVGEQPLRRFGAEQTRAFCYVDDAVRATRLLVESDAVHGGEIVHIGDDTQETRIGDLYERLFDLTGLRPARICDEPAPVGSPARRCPDLSRLRALTGYAPAASLDAGLRTCIAWAAGCEAATLADERRPPPARRRRIALAEPCLDGRDAERVRSCVESGWISAAGSEVVRLERLIEERMGASGAACALASGTAALHLALLAAGVRPGDLVAVPDLTFAGTVNPVCYLGASPVFLDVDDSGCLDPAALERLLRDECSPDGNVMRHRATGRIVRAVIPVHLLGHPAAMPEIARIARRHPLRVIEDAAEALGSTAGGRPVGLDGDFTVFSFNGNKIVTGGTGGALWSRDVGAVSRARHLSTQARCGLPDDGTEWVHDAVGFNYRMNNVAATLAASQLERLDDHVARKRRIAQRYAAELADVRGMTFHEEPPETRSNYWLSCVLVDDEAFGISRRELARRLGEADIETRPVFAPVSSQPAFPDGVGSETPVAHRIWRRALCLPSSAGLTEEDQTRVVARIRASSRQPAVPRAAAGR